MSAENGELGVSHRTDASVSQPGNNAQPEIVRPAEAGSSSSQPGETLPKTLSDINVNMGTMASLLQTIVARQDSKPQKKRRHSPHDLSTADSESEDNDHEASGKRSKAKQVRDTKDTNRIGKDIGVGKGSTARFSRSYNSHHDKRRPQKNYGKHYRPTESKPPF